eukprot:NODE_5934_length_949_cov_15.904358_g5347_i0.p1 GENE.NODE_5934_length_949_cov_15.904358_g5347_i0~~NODE_5934_length_949_cov_15.904358_g5347_i0.p1  ORF type:complete len:290 (-),score=33.18 NODE_5934_length_949_cov_15.904358_g5347_i0:78-893(-)
MYVQPDNFVRQYKVYSGVYIEKPDLDKGGKVILPASALQELSRLNIVWPMMFRLTSKANISTHCGPLEFSAPEGHIYVPFWMMEHLRVTQGQIITIQNASLPKGCFVKIRPQSKDFIEEISNPRSVLELVLRNFACLTKGDTILIQYNDRNYSIDIMEVKSKRGIEEAVSIVETDVEVDFDRPVDMPDSPVRPPPVTSTTAGPLSFSNTHLSNTTQTPKPAPEKQPEKETGFKPFTGTGRTLSGKDATPTPKAAPSNSSSNLSLSKVRDVP